MRIKILITFLGIVLHPFLGSVGLLALYVGIPFVSFLGGLSLRMSSLSFALLFNLGWIYIPMLLLIHSDGSIRPLPAFVSEFGFIVLPLRWVFLILTSWAAFYLGQRFRKYVRLMVPEEEKSHHY